MDHQTTIEETNTVISGTTDLASLSSMRGGLQSARPMYCNNTNQGQSAPVVGLLSRTLVHNPVVKWIFSARIRDGNKNDVVFIRDHSIEVKEFVDDRQLLDVGLKRFFDAKVQAARVMGAPTKDTSGPHVGDDYARVLKRDAASLQRMLIKEERPLIGTEADDFDMEVGGLQTEINSMEIETDGMKLEEAWARPNGDTNGDVKETINDDAIDINVCESSDKTPKDPRSAKSILPPQIIVLTLQSHLRQHLMIIFAYHDHYGKATFATYIRDFPRDRSHVHRLGAHLAVDPRSRAIAVGSRASSVIIYSLKPREQLKQEVDRDGRLMPYLLEPIEEEQYIEIKGVILHMEFLYTPLQAGSNVVALLLVISVSGFTYTRIYEWDTSMPLSSLQQVGEDHRLSIPESLPALVIPLTISPGFILVCDWAMMVYRDILYDHSEPQLVYYSSEEGAPIYKHMADPGASSEFPHWTAWTKPVRTQEYGQAVDIFFLGREDGVVNLFEVTADDVPVEHQTGRVGVNIDTAFAALDLGYKVGELDMLIIGGDMCDGGLFEFRVRDYANPLPQRLRNWSRILDFTVIRSDPQHVERSFQSPPPRMDRIFACASRGRDHGVLCEIRYGVEGFLQAPVIPLPDGALGSFTGLWLLPSQTRPGGYTHTMLIASYPNGSETFALSRHGTINYHIADSFIEYLVDCTRKTICAATTADGIAIQITTRALRAVHVLKESDSIPEDPLFKKPCPRPYRITHGYIEGRTSAYICVLWSKAEEDGILSFGRLSVIDGNVRDLSPKRLGEAAICSPVSCIFLQAVPRGHIAFVGTLDHELLVYVAGGQGLFQVSKHSFEEEKGVCESICLISLASESGALERHIVLCGLRNGSLHLLELVIQKQASFVIRHTEKIDIGQVSLSIIPDYTAVSDAKPIASRAIVCSHSMLFRITYSSPDAQQATLQRIWMQHSRTNSFPLESTSSVIPCEPWNFAGSIFAKSFVFIDEQKAHIVELDSVAGSGAVPRPIHVDGTPTRVVYSQIENKLVVAFTYTRLEPGDEGQKLRLMFPLITVIDPDEATTFDSDYEEERLKYVKDRNTNVANADVPQNPNNVVIGVSGEVVTEMMEWTPSLEGRRWPLIVISTARPQRNRSIESGKILIFRIGTDKKGRGAAKLKKTIARDLPVHSMAAIGDTHMVYGCGSSLELMRIYKNSGSINWKTTSSLLINSPARSISVIGTEIFVTTSSHSHLVCALEDEELVPKFNDVKARSGLHHHFLPEESIVMGSSMDAVVCGLWKPPAMTKEGSFVNLFEVRLNGSIIRIHGAKIGKSWLPQAPTDSTILIGSTMEGTFYVFDILDFSKWNLLRFVQNLISRNADLSPLSYRDFLANELEPSKSVPSDMHVDGDVLCRLMRGPISQARASLKEMATKKVFPAFPQFDFKTAEAREGRLLQLIREALPVDLGQDPYDVLLRELTTLLLSIV